MYHIFTGEELRKALGIARSVVSIGYSILIEKKDFYKKDSLEETLKEANDLNVKDKLEYLYRFLKHLSLLSEKEAHADGTTPEAKE